MDEWEEEKGGKKIKGLSKKRKQFLKKKMDQFLLEDSKESETRRVLSQKYAYKNWINFFIGNANKTGLPKIEDITTDLSDGLVLIYLYEQLTGKTVGKYCVTPTKTAQKLNNLTLVLDKMKKDKIIFGDIAPTDLLKGNEKMILSLIWQLIQSFSTENREEGVEKAVERMVEWGKKKAGRVGVDVYNLCGCFEGGLGFGAVLKGVSESFPWEECVFGDVGPAGALHNADIAFEYAFKVFGIPRLIRLTDLQALDESVVFTYLSLVKRLSEQNQNDLMPILHSVTLVGEAEELRTVLVGKEVRGVWKRWLPEKVGMRELGVVHEQDVLVLVRDVDKDEHLPLEVSIYKKSECEVFFSFLSDQVCTTEIEVFHIGERIGSTFVEICDPLPEEAFFWTQEMIKAEMLEKIKEEEEERVEKEREKLEREMEEKLREEEEEERERKWEEEKRKFEKEREKREQEILLSRLPEPLSQTPQRLKEEKEREEKEKGRRMTVAESRGISEETEKLVARIWREVDQGGEKVKEVKTFQVSKTLTTAQLCAASGRRWGVKAEELCVFEDNSPGAYERFNDPDALPTLDILDKLSENESVFDKLMSGANLYMKDAQTGQFMKIEPYDHNHFVDVKSKMKGRRRRRLEDKSYVQIQMEHDDLIFSLWRPGGLLVVPVERTTTARQVRLQILENMCQAVQEPDVQKRIKEYVHWWSIAEVPFEKEKKEWKTDRRLDWDDKVWPWRLGNKQPSSLSYKMCFRYFVFSIKYPPPDTAKIDQPFCIKIRIKDPRHNFAPAVKYDGVLEVVVVDGRDHNMTVVDCEPGGELGLFVSKFTPQKSGSHLAMVRFNGENIQNKWAKFSVSGHPTISIFGKKHKKPQVPTEISEPELVVTNSEEKREKRRSRHSEKRQSLVSSPIVKKSTNNRNEEEDADPAVSPPPQHSSPNPFGIEGRARSQTDNFFSNPSSSHTPSPPPPSLLPPPGVNNNNDDNNNNHSNSLSCSSPQSPTGSPLLSSSSGVTIAPSITSDDLAELNSLIPSEEKEKKKKWRKSFTGKNKLK